MTGSIIEKSKKQKYLTFLFVVLSIIAFLIMFFGVWGGQRFFTVPPPRLSFFKKELKINFEILENPLLKELQPFEAISLPKEKGRENPYLPY